VAEPSRQPPMLVLIQTNIGGVADSRQAGDRLPECHPVIYRRLLKEPPASDLGYWRIACVGAPPRYMNRYFTSPLSSLTNSKSPLLAFRKNFVSDSANRGPSPAQLTRRAEAVAGRGRRRCTHRGSGRGDRRLGRWSSLSSGSKRTDIIIIETGHIRK